MYTSSLNEQRSKPIMAGYPVQVDSRLPEYTGKAKFSMSEHECSSVTPGKALLQVQTQIEKSSFTS